MATSGIFFIQISMFYYTNILHNTHKLFINRFNVVMGAGAHDYDKNKLNHH